MWHILNNPHTLAVLSTLFGSLATAICSFLVYKAKKHDVLMTEMKKQNETRIKSQEELIAAVARYVLIKNFQDCMEKGYYPIYERDMYKNMYDHYTACGYNHVMGDLSEKLQDLPYEPPHNRRKTDKKKESEKNE